MGVALSAALAVSIVTLAGCSTWQSAGIPSERLKVDLPATGGWYEERRVATAAAVNLIYYPAGDNENNWDERVIESSVFGAQTAMPVLQAMEMSKRREERLCAGVVWKVLREARGDIAYEWYRESGCGGSDPRHEIGRYVLGDEAMHLVTYSAATTALPVERRDEWIRRIEGADLRSEQPAGVRPAAASN
jgi:hypothetical protein